MLETSLAYDNGVRTTSMVDVSGTSSWTYNAADEITDLNTPQGDVDYTYNLAGQILTLVDVGTGTTTNTYDSAGRPATTTDAFGDVSSYSYDSAGRLSQKNNPNGTYEVYTYDSRSRVTSIVTKNSSNAVLQSRVYTFDLASQVTQVVEGGVTTTYGYDNIGQLTSESKSSGYSGAYTYDANGNRLTRTVNSVTENYSYDSADKLTVITGGSDARSFTYDAAGRTTGIVRSSGTTAFSYDYESRVTSITKPGMTTNSFSYNGLDTRVGLVDSSGTKSFKRAGVGVTAPVLSDGTANFTPSGEKRGSTKTTFHSALKNDDVQTSSTQSVSASKVFDAFGNELGSSGSWKSQFGYAGRFGYQSDPDSGLKLLGHRYYDSDTGRFLTRDPVKHGRNWYRYSVASPAGRIDPEGLEAYIIDDTMGGLGAGFSEASRRYQIPGDDKVNWIDRAVKKGATNKKGPIGPTIIRIDPPHPGTPYNYPHINSNRWGRDRHREIPKWLQKVGKKSVVKGLSRACIAVAVADDVFTIANAEDKPAEAVKALTVWGGIAVGAAIGSAICPGIGTVIGGAIGGIGTGLIVYYGD